MREKFEVTERWGLSDVLGYPGFSGRSKSCLVVLDWVTKCNRTKQALIAQRFHPWTNDKNNIFRIL